MNCWLFITSPSNYEVCLNKKIWGVDKGYKITMMQHININDEFAFYATILTEIKGIYRVVSKTYYDNTPIGWSKDRYGENYPYRIDIEPLLVPKIPLSFKSLINELMFITDKDNRGWRSVVYPSIVVLPQRDFYIIKNKIQEENISN